MQRKLLLALVVLCGLLGFACDKKEVIFKKLPEGPIKHHLIVLGRTRQHIEARGFASATAPFTDVSLSIGAWAGSTTSLADGSFVIETDDADQAIQTAEFNFNVRTKIYQQTYRIRDVHTELDRFTKENFAPGKEISAISIKNDLITILSSTATLLQSFSIDEYFAISSSPRASLLLANTTSTAIMPLSLASLGRNTVVSLFGSHEVAIGNVEQQSVIARSTLKDTSGNVFRFTLTPALHVAHAFDADDSGVISTSITRSIARNTDGIFALDDNHFLVSFVNYYQFEDPSQKTKSVVGPGVIALMALEQNEIKTYARYVLPYKNPRYFVRAEKNNVWLACAGAWVNIGTSSVSSTDAGIVRIKLASDMKNFSLEQTIPLTNFSPAQPALAGTTLVVPHAEKDEVALIDTSTTTISATDLKKIIHGSEQFAFTFAASWHDDIVFLGNHYGNIVAFSVSKGYLAYPFIKPIVIDKQIGDHIGLRPQSMYFRHAAQQFDLATMYPRGYTAWVVSDIHNKIYAMDFLTLFGP